MISNSNTDLNLAVTQEDRMKAISAACVQFNHYDKDRHAKEVDEGAANALYQKLCLSVSGNKGIASENEVSMIFSALEMVYRCSTAKREESLKSIGKNLIPFTIHIIDRHLSTETAESDKILSVGLQLLYYFSRTRTAAIEVARTEGVFSTFIRIILGEKEDRIRAKAMVTIADLACHPESGPIVAGYPGLIDSVIQVASLDLSSEMREVATRTIQNMTYFVEVLPPRLFADGIKALVRVGADVGLKAKRYVAGALQNISTHESNQKTLVTINNGVVLDTLMNLIQCEDALAKQRALGTVKNVTSSGTAEKLCIYPGFLRNLASVASNDPNEDVRNDAGEVLCTFSKFINHNLSCHTELLNALVSVAQNREVSNIAQALMDQSRNPVNQSALVNFPGLLDVLSKLAQPNSTSSPEAKSFAVMALSNLARRK